MRIGFVGAGRMGRPMVTRLTAAGHDVRVLLRSPVDPARRRELEHLGATVVDGAADAAARSDAVVLCVFTDAQVRELCLDGGLLAAMAPGSALVVHTTTSPATIEAVAAGNDAVDVVDAPVSGGPHDVAAGRITLLVGGSQDAVTRLRPMLRCYGDPVLHVGPRGAGQAIKLVNNALFGAHIGVLAESVRLGEQLGVAESTLLSALRHGSATSRVLEIVAAGGGVAEFFEVAGEFVGKDVAVVRGIAEDLGAELGALGRVIDVLPVLDSAGIGDVGHGGRRKGLT